MRRMSGFLSCASLLLLACGSTNPDSAQQPPPSGQQPPPGQQPPASGGAFTPPPPPAGYTRVVAPVTTGIAAGADVMFCQYIQAPQDRDIDILDVQGYQSAFGHHAIAFASTANGAVGSTSPCSEEDNVAQGSFLGGVGGEGGGGVKLPDGVAFRLPKGSSILLNAHFLNTGSKPIDGHSVLDFKFAEVAPGRKVASLFSNVGLNFTIPAQATGHATADCTLPRDIDFLVFHNHMHDFGTSAITNLVRKQNPGVELVHRDDTWTYEMQFKAVVTDWPLDRPFRVAAGDTLHTECNWANTTPEAVIFPREMCVGVGYFLSEGSSAPVCMNGQWIER
jgi:hypothetical protein